MAPISRRTALWAPGVHAGAERDRPHLSRRAGQGPAECRRAEGAAATLAAPTRSSPLPNDAGACRTRRSALCRRSILSTAAFAARRNFRRASSSSFLWRAGLRYGLANPLKAADITLTNIAQGGIYDHLGGGFSRYSTDERWLVPHFEKMLYDNAQIVEQMTELWRENKSPLYAQRIEESIDWLLREMVTRWRRLCRHPRCRQRRRRGQVLRVGRGRDRRRAWP